MVTYVNMLNIESTGNAETAGYFAPILDSVTEQTYPRGVFRHIMFDVPEIKPPSNIARAGKHLHAMTSGWLADVLFISLLPSHSPRLLHAKNHKVKVFDCTRRLDVRKRNIDLLRDTFISHIQ